MEILIGREKIVGITKFYYKISLIINVINIIPVIFINLKI